MASAGIFKQLSPYFFYVLLVATVGPLLFGFHLAELNTPQDVITCKRKSLSATLDTSLSQCIPMTPAEIGLITSIFTLGGLIGALIAGPYASRNGRVRAMQTATYPFIIGPVFESLASGIPIMAVGRFISGVGAGAATVVVPIYISEIALAKDKGFFGAFTQIMTNTGILITQLLGYFLSYDQMWRLVLGAGGLIGLAQWLGLFAVVESPKWLIEQGRDQEAASVLQRLRGPDANIDSEVAISGRSDDAGLPDEEQTLLSEEDPLSHIDSVTKKASDKAAGMSMIAVLRHPDSSKAAIAVVMVMIAQQALGINSIIMYGTALLSDLLDSNSAILNLAVSALNIIMTTACAPLVDKIGRKACLLSSTAGMGISSLLLAIGITQSIPALSAVAVGLFVASFAVGLGPVPFILASELVGPEAVGATQAWALSANWIATFVVAQFFPIVNAALGKGNVYFVFTGLAVFFWLFIAWFVPETKGKTSADEVWGRSNERQD